MTFTFTTEALIRAMAPIEQIIDTFQQESRICNTKCQGQEDNDNDNYDDDDDFQDDLEWGDENEAGSGSGLGPGATVGGGEIWATEAGQGQFANIVSAILTPTTNKTMEEYHCQEENNDDDDDGNNYPYYDYHPKPTDRYIRKLLQRFVAKAERYHIIENEHLLELMMEHQFRVRAVAGVGMGMGMGAGGASTSMGIDMPDPKESCHVSYFIQKISMSYRTSCDGDEAAEVEVKVEAVGEAEVGAEHYQENKTDAGDEDDIIGIKIYPHHNDVGVRKVWEAGGALAEYIMTYPDLVRGKTVVELGAGVGLTGIAIAGECETHHVHMTDYTAATLENMEYNVSINQEWVRKRRGQKRGRSMNMNMNMNMNRCGTPPPSVTLGYLEWEEFSEFIPLDDNDDQDQKNDDPNTATLTNFNGVHLPSAQSLYVARQADVLIAADCVYDRNAIPPLVSVVHNFLSSSSKTASSKSKLAIIASTLRNADTYALFEKELCQKGIVCTYVPEEDIDGMHRIFPVYFVQPRTDVRICFMRASKENDTS